MDPVGGPHCDEADPLSAHRGTVGAGGAWATSGLGRSGADLNADRPARHQYHQSPLNIVAGASNSTDSPTRESGRHRTLADQAPT